jgi:hypothetical protein
MVPPTTALRARFASAVEARSVIAIVATRAAAITVRTVAGLDWISIFHLPISIAV